MTIIYADASDSCGPYAGATLFQELLARAVGARYNAAMDGNESESALDGARDLLRRRDAYKARLQEELREAEAKVAEIRTVIAELGGQSDPPQNERKSRNSHQALPPDASIAQLIFAALSAGPAHGMTSSEIAKAVMSLRPAVPRTSVYPTIARMEKGGRLVQKGDRYVAGKGAD